MVAWSFLCSKGGEYSSLPIVGTRTEKQRESGGAAERLWGEFGGKGWSSQLWAQRASLDPPHPPRPSGAEGAAEGMAGAAALGPPRSQAGPVFEV